MARQVLREELDQATCQEICEILERCTVVQSDEPDADSMRGLQQLNVIHAEAPVTLRDVTTLDRVRALLIRRMSRFVPASEGRIVADATMFKCALFGHAKPGHVDTEGFPQRMFTATMYFNACESGAICFGRLTPDGFVCDERLLPVPGMLVLFDSREDNAHQVEPFAGGVRYNVQAWFRFDRGEPDAPQREYDWTALYVFRTWQELRVRWIGEALEVVAKANEQHISGVAAGVPFRLALAPAEFEVFTRVVELGEFDLRDLVTGDDNHLELVLLLVCLLAQAGALIECALSRAVS